MKKIKFLLYGTAAIMLWGSCTKKINEAYTNPNAGVIQPIETLLPNVISNMAVSYTAQGTNYGMQNDGIYVGRYVQFWETNTAGSQYDQMGGATGGSDILGSIWAMHYYGQGQNLNRIIEWGTEQKKWDYVGVAYAIRAWSWLSLTDMYGEAILKQAFNTSILVFNYDSQQEIYAEVKRDYKLAMENLNKTGDGVSQSNLALGDQYFYNGDVNKWKKFANSVMARLYNRTTNKADYKADSVIFYANLGINDNADNGYVQFAGLGTSTNSFYGPFRGNIGTLRQSQFIANLESGLNSNFPGATDPRAWYLIREDAGTEGTNLFHGVLPNKGNSGLPVGNQPQNFWGNAYASTAGNNANARYIFKDASSYPIITAPEMHFLKAEAYFRKGDKANALIEYKLGISVSIDMLATDYAASVPATHLITPTSKADYLNNPVVVPTNDAQLTLADIMLQKYIALYGYGFLETWVDMRRYHYIDPETSTGLQVYRDFMPPAPADLFVNNMGEFVYRARPRYNSEYLYNVDALKLVGGLDLNYNTKKMWFSEP